MLEPREYSKRLGVLTHEQLQTALDRFDLGSLLDAAPAPGGLFGQIVLLATTKGGYVLRGNPHEGQLERERYVAGILHARTRVPAPHPYRIEDDPALFGWPWAIMPRLPGVQLADPEVRRHLTPEDQTAIVVALAECLALLHDARFDAVASYDPEAPGFRAATRAYAEWFSDRTRGWLERCRAASPATTDADVAWVEAVVAEAHAALAEPFTPRLVHNDFKENNTVAQRVEGGWRISGLFDLSEAHLGDGEYDLARAWGEYVLHRARLAQTYLRTYLALRPPRPGFEARFRHYVLHDRLIIWEYGQRNRLWFRPDQTLRPWVEPFLIPPPV